MPRSAPHAICDGMTRLDDSELARAAILLQGNEEAGALKASGRGFLSAAITPIGDPVITN
jgi:hypothetical protein